MLIEPKHLIMLIGLFYLFSENVHEQVNILKGTLMNVFSNFILNKVVTFNDKISKVN